MIASNATTDRFVCYMRVSTKQQGKSGLGLEAQQQAIEAYITQVHGEVVGDPFIEVESGKRSDRPQLAQAIAAAKRHRAVLLVAKLDRLARNLHFVTTLQESRVQFRAADVPEANELVVHNMSAMAQYEAKLISDRTKAGLAARKARGLSLGTPANLLQGNAKASTQNKADAQARAERMRPVIESIQAQGITSVRGICQALCDRGYLTENALHWHPTSVHRLLVRLGMNGTACTTART